MHQNMMNRNTNTSIIPFFKGLSVKKELNYALTIQPNNDRLNQIGLQSKMKFIEKRYKSHFFKNKKLRRDFFYIATIEHNEQEGYHLHLAITIPKEIETWFLKKHEDIIRKQIPHASILLKEIEDDGWISYMGKDLYQTESYENYFFSD